MRIIDHGLVYDGTKASPETCCAAFESLWRLHDGTLLCTSTVGSEKLSPRCNLQVMASTDAGSTWHKIADNFPTAFDQTPGSFSGGYISQRDDGTLLMNTLWFNREHPDRPIAHPQTSGLLPNACLLSESTDGGRHWSAFRKIDLSPDRGATTVGEIIPLNNGSLMLCYENWKEWEDLKGTQGSRARLSHDGGKTFGPTITIASDPDQQFYYWDGRFCKNPLTGEPIGMYWTHDAKAGQDTAIHMIIGTPDGQHWTGPWSTNIQGQVAAPVALRDGRLLCAYVHRHDPPSIRLVASTDMGKTWRLDEQIILHDSRSGHESGMGESRQEHEYWQDMFRWTFGHPKAWQLDDTTVLVTWYGGDGKYLSIHWAKVAV